MCCLLMRGIGVFFGKENIFKFMNCCYVDFVWKFILWVCFVVKRKICLCEK